MTTARSPLAQKLFERGRQFELQDREQEALDAYERAVSVDPGHPEAQSAVGRILAGRGRLEAALEALDRALADGEDFEAREWRAYVNGCMRRYERSLADYVAIIDALGEEADPSVRVNAGRMLLALRRYGDAEEMLTGSTDPQAEPLLDAIPRYREFGADEPVDDVRAVRYLFGSTVVLGTAGDGGHPLSTPRYLLLTTRHLAFTLGRFQRLAAARGWVFDGVVGEGPHHAPIAGALSALLDVPIAEEVGPGMRVLLASAVVGSSTEARRLREPWTARGARVFHFAAGLVPAEEPSHAEPDVVGMVGRCAVEWFRIEPWARMVPMEDDEPESEGEIPGLDGFPGMKVGPAYVDPNAGRCQRMVVNAARALEPDTDSHADRVLTFYERHRKSRAFEWPRRSGAAPRPEPGASA